MHSAGHRGHFCQALDAPEDEQEPPGQTNPMARAQPKAQRSLAPHPAHHRQRPSALYGRAGKARTSPKHLHDLAAGISKELCLASTPRVRCSNSVNASLLGGGSCGSAVVCVLVPYLPKRERPRAIIMHVCEDNHFRANLLVFRAGTHKLH